MRIDDERESNNVEDRRGSRGGRAVRRGGIGIGSIAIALVASYLFDINPATVLNLLSGGNVAVEQQEPVQNDAKAVFVSKILAETEDTWNAVFRASGLQYREPTLVLFSGSTTTACGRGERASGPFYCPADEKVYIDLAFYQELTDRYRAPGEFAEAYVIAHEIGHHVQNLLGISAKMEAAASRSRSEAEANGLSVKLELQADCLAGLWAQRTDSEKQILEPGEVEQALRAAAAIGDDQLQKASRGYAVPDTFTHGTSEQRMRWFMRGMQSGDFNQCDTFGATRL